MQKHSDFEESFLQLEGGACNEGVLLVSTKHTSVIGRVSRASIDLKAYAQNVTLIKPLFAIASPFKSTAAPLRWGYCSEESTTPLLELCYSAPFSLPLSILNLTSAGSSRDNNNAMNS